LAWLRHRCGYRCSVAHLVAEHVLHYQPLQPDCLAVDLEERRVLLKDRRLLLGDCLQDSGEVCLIHLPSADHSSGCCSAIATARALSCVTVPPRICNSSMNNFEPVASCCATRPRATTKAPSRSDDCAWLVSANRS